MKSSCYKGLCSALLVAALNIGILVYAADPLDFETAAATAQSQKQDMLVLLYGPDWDKAGENIKQKVWDPSIQNKMSGYLTLALPVYDLDDTDAKKELTQKNKKFRYKIWCYPAFAYCDQDGNPILVHEGAVSMANPEAVTAFTVRGKKIRDARDQFIIQADKVTGKERAELLGKALMTMELKCAKSHEKYIQELKKADPDDICGYQSVLNFSFEQAIGPISGDAVSEEEFKKQEARLDALLNNPVRPVCQKQEILAAKYSLYDRCGKKEEAEKALLKIVRLDPASPAGIGADTILKKGVGRKK